MRKGLFWLSDTGALIWIKPCSGSASGTDPKFVLHVSGEFATIRSTAGAFCPLPPATTGVSWRRIASLPARSRQSFARACSAGFVGHVFAEQAAILSESPIISSPKVAGASPRSRGKELKIQEISEAFWPPADRSH